MRVIWERLLNEPNLAGELLRQIVIALVTFGVVQWTDAQQGVVLGGISMIVALATRQVVTPTRTLPSGSTGSGR